MHKKKLVYVTPNDRWIRRCRRGKGFIYVAPGTHKAVSKKILKRIEKLGIPPAYEDVLICPNVNGHIQAIGHDKRRRKQYIYHPDWVVVQSKEKFKRLVAFGVALTKIRRRVALDLRKKKLSKEKILAAMVKIMDLTHIRVGNDTYAKTHETYGLTTLRKKHVNLKRNQILFSFKGKNETPWVITLQNPAICKVIKKCAEIPGHVLFKFEDADGVVRPLCSEEFNDYLASIGGEEFTAKDFRTWAACCLLFEKLVRGRDVVPEKRSAYLKAALEEVAQKMGHTVAVCRRSYIHPLLIKSFETGAFQKWLGKKKTPNTEKHLLKWWKDHVKGSSV